MRRDGRTTIAASNREKREAVRRRECLFDRSTRYACLGTLSRRDTRNGLLTRFAMLPREIALLVLGALLREPGLVKLGVSSLRSRDRAIDALSVARILPVAAAEARPLGIDIDPLAERDGSLAESVGRAASVTGHDGLGDGFGIGTPSISFSVLQAAYAAADSLRPFSDMRQ